MKIISLTSLLAAAAMVTSVGIAQADEPMRLSESSMDGVTAGSIYSTANITKYVDTYNDSYLNQYKNVYSSTYVQGQLADAEAIADCYSYNCLTETLTATNVSPYSTGSYSGSISASY